MSKDQAMSLVEEKKKIYKVVYEDGTEDIIKDKIHFLFKYDGVIDKFNSLFLSYNLDKNQGVNPNIILSNNLYLFSIAFSMMGKNDISFDKAVKYSSEYIQFIKKNSNKN